MADRNVRIVNKRGKNPTMDYFPKAASTAFDKNSLVEFGSGTLNPADDNDTLVLGIIQKEVATTDTDYASASMVGVEVIQEGDEVEIDCTAALTRGTTYGISNAYTVDQSDTSNKVFTCTVPVSSTRARGFFVKLYSNTAV